MDSRFRGNDESYSLPSMAILFYTLMAYHSLPIANIHSLSSRPVFFIPLDNAILRSYLITVSIFFDNLAG